MANNKLAINSTTPDVALATKEGTTIVSFIRGLVPFFATAQALEVAAKQTLADAKALVAPTTADADEQIQRFAKRTTVDRKAVETHWEITSIIHGFHRKLVSARTRATEPLEQAGAIANALHNNYTDAEKRRVRLEQERLQREADDRQARERQAELLRMEAEAVAREEASPELSDREQRFVDTLVAGAPGLRGDATACARYVGYKDPIKTAARLLTLAKIQTAIRVMREAIAIRTQAKAVKASPVEPVEVERVQANISRHAGSYDRTTWSAEITDEGAFIDAVFAGKHGIPRDCLMIDPSKVSAYARDMHELIDRWPGVRSKKSTKVV